MLFFYECKKFSLSLPLFHEIFRAKYLLYARQPCLYHTPSRKPLTQQNATVFTQFQLYRIFPLIARVLTSCGEIILFVASDLRDYWKPFCCNIYWPPKIFLNCPWFNMQVCHAAFLGLQVLKRQKFHSWSDGGPRQWRREWDSAFSSASVPWGRGAQRP